MSRHYSLEYFDEPETTLPSVLSAYCHCTRCQRLSGAPFIATVHLPPHVFSWSTPPPPISTDSGIESGTSPDERPISDVTDVYTIIEVKHRYRCKTCGAGVASYNAKKNKWSVWAATLDRDTSGDDGEGKIIGWEYVKPTAHIFYGTRMLDVNDGLGKWEGYANQSKRIE